MTLVYFFECHLRLILPQSSTQSYTGLPPRKPSSPSLRHLTSKSYRNEGGMGVVCHPGPTDRLLSCDPAPVAVLRLAPPPTAGPQQGEEGDDEEGTGGEGHYSPGQHEEMRARGCESFTITHKPGAPPAGAPSLRRRTRARNPYRPSTVGGRGGSQSHS